MEIWLPISICNDYEISSKGRIKSLKGKEPRILNPSNDGDGYLMVLICKEGIRYPRRIHRLVAEAYIPNPDNKPCVNHKNGIKMDNRIENLEWVTTQENTQHAWKNGLNNNVTTNGYKTIKYAIEATKRPTIWYNDTYGSFKGTAAELIREYPSLNLWSQHLSGVLRGKLKKHKGWKIYE
jgi:hypothetical protein